jgi:hypothetical protein
VNKTLSILLNFAVAMLIPGLAFNQVPGEVLDLKRIPQRSVRKLVQKENVKTATDFQYMATSCYQPGDSARYQINLRTLLVKAPIGKVWEKYVSITPKEAWSGRTTNFAFLFSKPENQFFYPGNADEPLRVGSIIFVNLRLLKGIKNLGVGFEITRLDEVSKTICFCYLKDGASNGSQEIQFTEMANGDTKISHLTHYRSRSVFRDKRLYPFFHDKFVNEFHQNIIRHIASGL